MSRAAESDPLRSARDESQDSRGIHFCLGELGSLQPTDLMEDFADEQGSLIQVSENSNWENFQRMFPFEAAGSGRVLRVQATPGANPVVELRLKNAAEQEKYNNIICGMFWHRDQGVGTAFPLTPIYRQKAIWMTCQHVAAGE